MSRHLLLAAALLCAPTMALAQRAPNYMDASGHYTQSLGIVCLDPVTGVPVSCAGTGGGGGSGSANAATTSNATDGQATSTTNQQNVAYNYVWNGTAWDRVRGTNGSLSVLLPASAATSANQTATQSSPGTAAPTADTVQGSPNGVPVKVATPSPATVVTGQVKIVTTGTPVALPSIGLVNGIVVKAKSTNQAQAGSYSGMVGPSGVATTYDGTGSGYPLAPGEAASFAVSNSNLIYVNGTAGDVFSYEGN